MKFPNPNTHVLARFINRYGKRFHRICYHVPKHYLSESDCDFEGDCDYSEDKDEYFHPEGWYGSPSYDDICWQIDGEVEAWISISELPEF